MKKYEAMFIIKPNLSEEEKKALYGQIEEAVTKNGGAVSKAGIWSERKKLFFPIKKQEEGVYYLVNFDSPPDAITKIKQVYKLNDAILRALITIAA